MHIGRIVREGESHCRVVRKHFKRIDAPEQPSRVTEAIQQVLASDPDIRDVE
jgi:hypothetical protein